MDRESHSVCVLQPLEANLFLLLRLRVFRAYNLFESSRVDYVINVPAEVLFFIFVSLGIGITTVGLLILEYRLPSDVSNPVVRR